MYSTDTVLLPFLYIFLIFWLRVVLTTLSFSVHVKLLYPIVSYSRVE